ncbi:MAG: C10 family peptidase [Spirochaetes bacterium]|nr:C10 family peptidase [Spirochaetota bacterium]
MKSLLFAFFVLCLSCFPHGTRLDAQALPVGDDTVSRSEVSNVSLYPEDNELAAPLAGAENTNVVVAPLIQTRWHQRAPYNDLFPMVDGSRAITDCSNIALAQILRFHQYPSRGTSKIEAAKVRGIAVGNVDFGVVYDWKNMLAVYRSDNGDSTVRQREAVAGLLFQLDAARGTSKSNGNIPVALTEYFGYDKSIERHWRIYYNDADWQAMIRSQLDAGLPVYYWGNDPNTSHTFVVDGYDSTGKFHINLGWGGRHDGWYFLDNLNPPSHGRSWYDKQTVIINIKPDEGGNGSGELFITGFRASKIDIAQNEVFTVTVDLRSPGFFPGGQAGVALVAADDSIVMVLGIANYSERNPGTSGTREIDCFVPESVSPGQYRLMTAVRLAGQGWKLLTRSAVGNGISNAIDCTISSGVSNGGGYGLAIRSITPDTTSAAYNERFAVVARTRNISPDNFPGGQMGVALVDNQGSMVTVIGSVSFGALNPGSTWTRTISNCSVPETVARGQYQLMIVVRPEGREWRIATMSVENTPTSIDFTVR